MNPSLGADLPLITTWWAMLFLIGACAFPLARKLFSGWWDQGYLLSKALGLLLTSWIVWQLGSFHILPYSNWTIYFALAVVFIGAMVLSFAFQRKTRIHWSKIVALEALFFISLLFWSFIKGHESDIRSLEKFMDYGFSRAVQQTEYFPPPDMWYAGGTINYYYFGHLAQGLLSTAADIDLAYGYNLMLASLFALCLTMSFGIGVELYLRYARNRDQLLKKQHKLLAIIAGAVGALLVTLSGNLQTIYAFTQGYVGESPPGFWTVLWKPIEFLTRLPEGLNLYWYANATRFIPFTIHEFPAYSFVVSDNHGHVLNIPFVLLMIAGLITVFGSQWKKKNAYQLSSIGRLCRKTTLYPTELISYGLLGALVGVLLMTNALDGPIYGGLLAIFILVASAREERLSKRWFINNIVAFGVVGTGMILATIPFILNFKSFASGLAINCPPAFLENVSVGPLLFETVDKCQKSPFWMMIILWGFFWFIGGSFIITLLKIKLSTQEKHYRAFSAVDQALLLFFVYSVGLIIFAEFFYFKDIYPAHFRSNTMFKLGYQAFIMSSLLAGQVIVRGVATKAKQGWARWGKRLFILLLVPQLFLVIIFPLFAVRSYFGGLREYKGLYGLSWFKREYQDDYWAMVWLNQQLKETSLIPVVPGWLQSLAASDLHVRDNFFTRHIRDIPVIAEADGDSYTDYGRFSSFTGLPTLIGWGVHEWLWRGSYDIVAPRKDEIREFYETGSQSRIREISSKYGIRYIIIGALERQKFVGLDEHRFKDIAKLVFQSGSTSIYLIDK